MIQERSYSSAIFFAKTIFSEHLEKENMVFRAVLTSSFLVRLRSASSERYIYLKTKVLRYL